MKNQNIITNITDSLVKIYKDNRIIIENYIELLDLSNNTIKITNFIIEGDDLIVRQMDKFVIEITGKIKAIKFI